MRHSGGLAVGFLLNACILEKIVYISLLNNKTREIAYFSPNLD